MPAIPLSLKVLESRQVTSKVAVEYEKGRSYTCNLTLLNSISEVCDIKTVSFNTSDRHTDQGSQGGNGNRPKGQNSVKKTDSDLSCDDFCPSWYDLPCFVVKSCWGKFFGFIGILVGIIVVVIVAKVVMRKYGICCYKCCTLPQGFTKESNSPVEEKTKEYKESGESCYFNSPIGFESLGINKPASLKGKLVTTRKGSYFLTSQGKRFFLTSQQIMRYISPIAEYDC
jgi:hypothetical protein